MLNLKYMSLIILILQTTSLVLTMRYSRIQVTENEIKYLTSTAVLLAEVVKVLICLIVIFYNENMKFGGTFKSLKREVWDKYKDTLKVFIPAGLYTVQNNLLYVALSNLDAATYQVTYQLKILTTALFSVLLLHRKLRLLQWMSLVALMFGVSLVQIRSTGDNNSSSKSTTLSSQFVGLISVILACISSGFSGVYFEKILKESQVTLWMRNFQMGLLSIVLAGAAVVISDYNMLMKYGFFQGYNKLTLVVIMLQAVGGLIIAVVIKYADNILKGFATSVSIVMSFIVSFFVLGDFVPSWFFFIGAIFVLTAVFLYGYVPNKTDDTTLLPK